MPYLKRSGVYAVLCVPTDQRYVGSTINLNKRWFNHRDELNRGVSNHRKLQEAWREQGPQAFAWQVLEYVEPDRLVEREQYWMDHFSAGEHGLNVEKYATRSKPLGPTGEKVLPRSQSRSQDESRVSGRDESKGCRNAWLAGSLEGSGPSWRPPCIQKVLWCQVPSRNDSSSFNLPRLTWPEKIDRNHWPRITPRRCCDRVPIATSARVVLLLGTWSVAARASSTYCCSCPPISRVHSRSISAKTINEWLPGCRPRFLREVCSLISLPRGSGKTSIATRSAIWALAYKHRSFVSLLGATQRRATDILKTIKTESVWNPLITSDFWQICYPLVRLGGHARLAIGQHSGGCPTRVEWGNDRLVLPTVPSHVLDGVADVSGSVVSVAGLTGAIRGQSSTLATGEVIRPEFVILDDPSTRRSAMSPTQCQARLELINADVLAMAGPDSKIAAVACPHSDQGWRPGRRFARFRTLAAPGMASGASCSTRFQRTKSDGPNMPGSAQRIFGGGGNGSVATAYYLKKQGADGPGSECPLAGSIPPGRSVRNSKRHEPQNR